MKERPIPMGGFGVKAVLEGRKTQGRQVIKPGRGKQAKWLTMDCLLSSPRAQIDLIDGTLGAQFAHPLAGKTYGGVTNDEWSPLTWIKCPYGQPGDRLWVKETWRYWNMEQDSTLRGKLTQNHIPTDSAEFQRIRDRLEYRATPRYPESPEPWRPSIFMYRWASRITLEITDVSVERVQDITEDAAQAEGIEVELWDMAIACRDYSKPDGWFQGWDNGFETPYIPDDEICRASFRTLWDSINAKCGFGWDVNPWVWVVKFKVLEAR